MIRCRALCVLLLVGGAFGAGAQETIQFRNLGPGPGGQLLQQALASPHVVIPPANTQVVLHRDSTFRQNVIVLGRDAAVEGTVQGDVVVVGGDLHVHPRAKISGRAVAIGGGVYESALSDVGGGTQAFRDFTYDIAAIPGGWALTYRRVSTVSEPFAFQSFYGLKLPTYDRSNGLSLAVAPAIPIPGGRAYFEPRLTYRSQLGRLDPSIVVADTVARGTAVSARVGRGTFSNDAWIWSDFINSLEVLWDGHDTRNHFRAFRGELTLSQRHESATLATDRYAGVRLEDATSVRPDSNATGGPWSLIGRNDIDDMRRPNPPIDAGRIRSLIAGTQLEWTPTGIVARLRVDGEIGMFHPECATCLTLGETKFGQATIDAMIHFPTFGLQSLRFDAHAVLTTTTDGPPRQRWAYIGGSGSIPTTELLSRGGDELLYLDGRYAIPLERVTFPCVGHPVITLREVIGGATTGAFPTLDQATGARLSVSYVYVEWLIDPVSRKQHHSFGLTLAR